MQTEADYYALFEALDRGELAPDARASLRARLRDTTEAIRSRAPALRLTLDLVESRGFRYHTGLCMTVFAPSRAEELGRGGRYLSADSEPATGITLFPDAMLRVCPRPAPRPRAYLPWGSASEAGIRLRADGFVPVPALDDTLALHAHPHGRQSRPHRPGALEWPTSP